MAGPDSYDRLIQAITARHDTLGRRARDIARFVIQYPNDIALSSSKTLAAAMGVQSSNLVRFAQGFCYAGFSEMQRVFQARLVAEAPGRAEHMHASRPDVDAEPHADAGGVVDDMALDRLRDSFGGPGNTVWDAKVDAGRPVAAQGTLQRAVQDFVAHEMAALREFAWSVPESTLALAADTLAHARTIFIAGQLQAFPIAAYLHYAMLHLRRPVHLVSVGAGLASEIAQLSGPDDVLVAVSFRLHAKEIVDMVGERARLGVPVLAITDSVLSPLTRHALANVIVPAGDPDFASSLAAPMCAAQSLVMAMAARLPRDLDNANGKNAQ